MRALIPSLISLCALCACTRGPKIPPSAEHQSAAAPSQESPSLPPGHPNTHDGMDDPHAGLDMQGVEASAQASKSKNGLPMAGSLVWNPPRLFEEETPSSNMRAAQYKVSGQSKADATLAVFYFGTGQGGDVQSNIDRWIAQFSQEDGSSSQAAAKIAKTKVGALGITTVDVSGIYDPGPMMAPHAGGEGAKTKQRMLAAIAQGPQGPVFFKLTGPSKTVALAETAFSALVNSIHVEQ
ncbi:MAG: hypothetical protein IPJ88_09735 [Myxococcales bacterium]|nr:MAG: hypothetical protein IPJ88_09735 [Myxococcales bacterium]